MLFGLALQGVDASADIVSPGPPSLQSGRSGTLSPTLPGFRINAG